MIKAILFDMDGVLIDSEPIYNRVAAKAFEKLGIPYGVREITAVTGANNIIVADAIISWYPHLASRHEEIAAMYEDTLYGGLCAEASGLIPGVTDWIRRAKENGLKVAIGSSSSNRMVYFVADTYGLTPLMDSIVTGEMVKKGKPFPDIYLRVCEELGLQPDDCIIIEDSVNGLMAGRRAGTLCAAFHGTNRHGMDLSDCDMAFDAYTDEAWERLIGATRQGSRA